MDNNDQILDEFLLEAQEIFDQLDLDFVALEQNPEDKNLTEEAIEFLIQLLEDDEMHNKDVKKKAAELLGITFRQL